MKNKKWIALTTAVILAVTALPVTVFAKKKDSSDDKMLAKVTLTAVVSAIHFLFFMQILLYKLLLLRYAEGRGSVHIYQVLHFYIKNIELC